MASRGWSWVVHLERPRLNLVDGADVGDAAQLEAFLDDFLGQGLLQGRQD